MRMRQHTEHHEAEAVCDVPDCEWWKSQTGYQTCRRAARKHIKETGHTVTVYVQVAKTIYPSDPKEDTVHFELFGNRAYVEEVHRRMEDAEAVLGIDVSVFDGMEGQLAQAHIDTGTVNHCRECPVALALNDMLAEHGDKIGQTLVAEVNRLYIYFHTDETRSKCVLVMQISALLDEWISDFDDGKTLVPGKLYVEKDGKHTGVNGIGIQHWTVGIDVPDAYYNDPIGFEDNSVNWGN